MTWKEFSLSPPELYQGLFIMGPRFAGKRFWPTSEWQLLSLWIRGRFRSSTGNDSLFLSLASFLQVFCNVSFLYEGERESWKKKSKCWNKRIDKYFFNAYQTHKKYHKYVGNDEYEDSPFITCFPSFFGFYFFVSFVDFFDFLFNIFHKKSPIKKVKTLFGTLEDFFVSGSTQIPYFLYSLKIRLFFQNILPLSDSTRVNERYLLLLY